MACGKVVGGGAAEAALEKSETLIAEGDMDAGITFISRELINVVNTLIPALSSVRPQAGYHHLHMQAVRLLQRMDQHRHERRRHAVNDLRLRGAGRLHVPGRHPWRH